jgi:hypothetical protein
MWLLLGALATAAPVTFQHQGRLTTTSGDVMDGEVSLTFSLHSSSSGAAFWAETATVAVQDGYYGHTLGSVTTLQDSQLSGELWLEVAQGSVILAARQRVREVPLAARARVADALSSTTGLVLIEQSTVPAVPASGTGQIYLRTNTHHPSDALVVAADGTNGSTGFSDGTLPANTVTPVGGAVMSTAQAKFGSSSAYLAGGSAHGGAYLHVPTGSDFTFGTGDLTVDFWVQRTTGSFDGLFGMPQSSNGSGCDIMYDGSQLGWVCGTTNHGDMFYRWVSASMPTNTWHHVALTRSGNTFRLFLNGSQVDTVTHSGSIGPGGEIRWGSVWSAAALPLDGYLDEMRVTKGYARWTANFTPPASPSAGTGLFLQLSDGQVYQLSATPL